MDFLINNIGWFFCIAIVSVLALIGYKADKKEKQSNANPKYIPSKSDETEKINEKEEKQDIKNDDFYYNLEQQNKEQNDIEENNFYYNPQEKKISEEVKPMENNQQQMDAEMAALYEPLPPMQSQVKTEENSVETKEENPLNEIYYSEPQATQEIQQQSEESQYPAQEVQQQAVETQQPVQEPQPTQEVDQIVPDINNLENLNISLQDLENKNYNLMLNKMNKQPEPQNENTQVEQLTNEQNQEQQNIQQPVENQIEQPQEIQQEVPEPQENVVLQNEIAPSEQPTNEQNQEQQTENQIEQPQEIPEIQEPQNEIMETNQDVAPPQPETNEHQFDNEINNEEIESSQTVETPQPPSNDFTFNKQETVYDGEIPELFANNQQDSSVPNDMDYLEKSEISKAETEESNLYSDSIDDDIWKF